MILSTAMSAKDARPADGPLTYGFPLSVYKVPAVELDCSRYACEPRIQYANLFINAVFWYAVSIGIAYAYSNLNLTQRH